MSRKIKYFTFLFILLLWSWKSLAQTGKTPYSSQGLGYLSSPSFIHNLGMGGIGIAAGNGLHINNINPALLYRNNLSAFDIGISGEYKDLTKGDETGSAFSGGLLYGAFAFPAITNRWTFSLGLMPYSTVGYTIEESRTVTGNGGRAQLSLEGEGGISQVYFSNGIRVYDNLALGLKVSYLFGSIDRSLSLLPLTTDNFSYITSSRQTLFYSGLLPEAGLSYSLKVGDNAYLSVGGIFQPQTSIKANRSVRFESRDLQNSIISQDTITNEPGSVIIPQKYGVGIAMEKYPKYVVGVDITLQDWENFGAYRPDSINAPRSNEALRNSFQLAAGGEFIPDASSVNSYLKRVSYRAGFNYRNTPFYVNNEQIREISVTLGFSLPLSSLSSLNLALEGGQRGSTTNELIRENYFKVSLGTTFNDRWFIRRKYD